MLTVNGTVMADQARCATGDDVLKQLSFEDVDIWFVVLMNTIIGFAFHIFAFMLLSARSTKYLAIEKVKSV